MERISSLKFRITRGTKIHEQFRPRLETCFFNHLDDSFSQDHSTGIVVERSGKRVLMVDISERTYFIDFPHPNSSPCSFLISVRDSLWHNEKDVKRGRGWQFFVMEGDTADSFSRTKGRSSVLCRWYR